MARYSRRFTMGRSRYNTQAFVEDGAVIIHQTERVSQGEPYSSTIILRAEDFKKLVRTLGLDS